MAKHKALLTQEQLRQGVGLCRANSRRLATLAAQYAREFYTDARLVYAIWSLALEELGKARLLQKQLDDRAYDLQMPLFRGMHPEKFAAGLAALESMMKLPPIPREAVISKNASDRTAVFEQGSSVVAVPAGATGRFQDATHGDAIAVNHLLRHASLYVDFDEGRWVAPGEVQEEDDVNANWDIGRATVMELIDCLINYLNSDNGGRSSP